MTSLIWKLAWGVVLSGAVLAVSAGARKLDADPARPSVDQVGGSILVYEVDETRRPADYNPHELAAALKRRIDPADLYNISIRPVGKNRMEIAVPTRKGHADQIRTLKELLAQTGALEFRIVANQQDDQEAIDAARKYFAAAAKDAKLQGGLEQLAKQGQPPPSPRPAKGDAFATPKGRFTYSWVEVGRSELRTLNLDNAAERDTNRSGLWRQAAEARKEGKTVSVPLSQLLLFSRECQDGGLTAADRAQKKFDYFLLCRNPAQDPKTEQAKRISGQLLESVQAAKDAQSQPMVTFRFNKQGSELFFDLTSRNRPTPTPAEQSFYRHIAIILDAQIMSAPRLNSPIRSDGVISGRFTQREVDNLVNILRAGALPATLKPLPVSETTVEPKKKRNPGPK